MAALRREPGAPHLLDARRGGGLRAPIAGATPVDTAAADALAVFDKAAKLLLVGAADEVRALTEVCARWRAQGHAGVRVLAGGVEALPPAAAAAAPPAPPVFVSAGMLQRQAALAPASLVFDAGTDAPLQRIGRAANVARPGEAPRHAARRIARELARSGVVAGLDPLIVVVADHRAAPAWREAWQATAYANPRFYLGSDAEFRVALARDERMATDRGKPLPGPCDR
ncbi:hypothetical protein DFR29_108114 [Tahibacter aquaticus]|uniref:Uncharacterized protein n=2 Tax=Tahibacter aquaticus TaxID=520092 RepID=A0A4R6YV72_9GAMM|nr:hypothetical protein DFR29_108114 [Tahibacter aquaticus]